MQFPHNKNIDMDPPLFDVVISMPPGAKLETIQKLAETEACLPLNRVEQLINVLRYTPNAKVATEISFERAQQESALFTKAGLDAKIIALKLVKVLSEDNVTASVSSQDSLIPKSDAALPRLKSHFPRKSGLLVGAALVIVVGLYFAGKQGITVNGVTLPWAKKSQVSEVASSPNLPQTQLATAAEVFESAGDLLADDPLVLAASGRRTGARGPTLDEAVADLTGLAGSTQAVDGQLKQLLMVEFALLLAELGQDIRAKEVFRTVASDVTPASDSKTATRLAMVPMELQAWAIVRMESGQAKIATEELHAKTRGIADAKDRTYIQAYIADILSRQMQVPPDASRAFLSRAAESLKSVAAPQSETVRGDLTVLMAKVFLRQATSRARTGSWSKAKAGASQVEALAVQAPNEWTRARIYAIDYQANLQTGQYDKAAKSLRIALELAGKAGNMQQHAVWLRSVAQLSDAGTQEQFESAVNALTSQANLQTGVERAKVLTELYLLYLESSLPGKAALLRSQAQATNGLNPTERTLVNVDLVARGDMAIAKMLHGQGRYVEAEAVLQRIGGYLF